MSEVKINIKKKPISSYGIILVNIDDYKVIIKKKQNILKKTYDIDDDTINYFSSKIKFLLISRKNSLGYVEFIRGRYKPEKIDQLIHLFRQMKTVEIKKIKYSLGIEDSFNYLWNNFWGFKANSPHIVKDKLYSQKKFNMIKTIGLDGAELDLNFIISVIKPDYDTEEWGFPKGRKTQNETDQECAKREFIEETGFNENDFTILNNINPITEQFTGTNGIEYSHIYYIAQTTKYKKPQNNLTESQKQEVGNIQYMTYDNAMHSIRDYHSHRKYIIDKLYQFFLHKLSSCEYISEKSSEEITSE